MRSFAQSLGSVSSLLVALSLALSPGLTGCEDKKAPPPIVSATATPEEIAKMPLAELVPPADVVVYGGVEDIGKIADPLSAMAALVAPGAGQLKTRLPLMAAETLGLTNADALDLTKPVRVVVLDPKKHLHGFGVFLIHVKDEASLVATAPPTRAINDQGNAYGWDIQGGRMYANIVGDVAIFSMEAGIFPADQQFLKQLSVATAPPGATLIARAANIVALYGADFEQALAAMKAQQDKLPEAQARAMANIVNVDQGLYSALKDLDTLTLSLRPTDDGLVMSYTARARAGTSLETAFKSLKPKADNALLARFPKSSPAYLAASLSPDSLQSMQGAMKWILTLSLPPEQAERFLSSWSDLVAASTGEFLVGAYPGKDGLVVGGMSGVKDADKARAAQTAMLGMYDDPSMKDALEKAGIKTTVKPKAYKIGDVDVTVTKSELKTLPPGGIGAALAAFLETHSAIGKDAAYLAYGPNAKETLTALVDGNPGKDGPELGLAGSPGMERAKKNGTPSPIVEAYLAPSALAGGSGVGGDGSGIVITMGAKDGVVELAIDVPTSQIGPTMMALAQLRNLGAPPPLPATSASAGPATKPKAPPPPK